MGLFDFFSSNSSNSLLSNRVVHFGLSRNLHPDSVQFCSNYVTTSKYTFYNFLAKNLFEQLVGNFSPSGKYTTLVPLLIVLIFSAVKEAFEDIKRHKSDKEVNTRICRVLSGGSFIQTEWQDLNVGDIVKIEENHPFPADLILLSTSDQNGVAFVETANLDGETNLKLRQASKITCSFQMTEPGSSEPDISTLSGILTCDPPNNNLYEFEGVFQFGDSQEKHKVSPKQLLLRGCTLRNTDFLYGLVFATGNDTKLVRNSQAVPIKFSRVDGMTNTANLLVLLMMFLMCLAATIFNVVAVHDTTSKMWYLDPHNDDSLEADPVSTFFTFAILVNFLLPVSLYVTLEVVKYICGTFIDSDLSMFYAPSDIPAKAISSSLVEELGQIDYIFSDKTGTLTQNVMQFRKCSVGGEIYGIDQLNQPSEVVPTSSASPSDRKLHLESQPLLKANRFSDTELRNSPVNDPHDPDFYVKFNDSRFKNHLLGNDTTPQQKASLMHFVNCLAVCQSVLPDFKPSADISTPALRANNVHYQASSPDENALVAAARHFGIQFHHRDLDSIKVYNKHTQTDMQFEILDVLPFNSTRKRMSVVVRGPPAAFPDGKNLLLYTKGADSVIYERLAPSVPDSLKNSTMDHLGIFAREGLRTLCLAYRHLDPDFYQSWASRYATLDKSLNMDSKKKAHEMEKLAAELETDLILAGSTAIEDKLQDNVPETLQALSQAGIKIWVLTGDKLETAINIGFSSKLLTKEMDLLLVTEKGSLLDEDEQPTSTGRPDDYRSIQEIVEDTLEKHLKEQRSRLQQIGFGDRSLPQWFQKTLNRITSRKPKGLAATEELPDIDSTPRQSSDINDSVAVGSLDLDNSSLEQDLFMRENNTYFQPETNDPFFFIDQNDLAESTSQAPLAMVISGKALEYALLPKNRFTLLQLGRLCQSVICCRVSPKQKAEVVHLVKDSRNLYNKAVKAPTTLSIGDGANDVSMILEAHVGVGIAGLEGMQAARSADFSIGQFSYLKPLLFKHGRWNYRRCTKLIEYSFWKNCMFTMTQIYFSAYNGWSSQLLFEQWVQASFNVLFSSGAIMLYALLEQDVNAKLSLEYPELYRIGPKNTYLNPKSFILNSLVMGMLQGALLFYISYFGFNSGILSVDGKTSGIWAMGTIVYTALVITINLQILLSTHFVTLPLSLMIGWSILCFVLFNLAYGALPLTGPSITLGDRLIGVQEVLLSQPGFWLLVLLSVVACMLPDYIRITFNRRFNPSIVDHVRFQSRFATQRAQRRKPLIQRILDRMGELGISDLSAPTALKKITGFAFSEPEVPEHYHRHSVGSASDSKSPVDQNLPVPSSANVF